jgi:hypothetical protein
MLKFVTQVNFWSIIGAGGQDDFPLFDYGKKHMIHVTHN